MSARTLRSADDLSAAGLIAPGQAQVLERVADRYAVAITPAIASLISGDTSSDPIARQFVPSGDELILSAEETPDPIGDHPHTPVKGIVHRYQDRALLKVTHTCPVYCRFCFRREMVGPDGDGTLTPTELTEALDYITSRPAIREVIVTGGDPFVLSARRIRDLTRRIAAIGHVSVIRWHTRVPVVQPERLTPAFVAALTEPKQGKVVFVAIHANHAREFSAEARAAIARLADAGVALVSQSVLLQGVNDSVEALVDLMRAFVGNRIKPYYLHQGDLAPGTAHFRVPIATGLALMTGLRAEVSGLAVPTYVLDLPGGFGKVPVASGVSRPDGRLAFTDRKGRQHLYPPVADA